MSRTVRRFILYTVSAILMLSLLAYLVVLLTGWAGTGRIFLLTDILPVWLSVLLTVTVFSFLLFILLRFRRRP